MNNEIPLRIGEIIPQGNWPEDRNCEFIGGNECLDCGGIFIGAEGRTICRECATLKTPQDREIKRR